MPNEFMNKCYSCKYRADVIGSAHSQCKHPAVRIMYGARDLGIIGNSRGIKHGWFIWPLNFDPVWLENCDGFEQKEVVSSTTGVKVGQETTSHEHSGGNVEP